MSGTDHFQIRLIEDHRAPPQDMQRAVSRYAPDIPLTEGPVVCSHRPIFSDAAVGPANFDAPREPSTQPPELPPEYRAERPIPVPQIEAQPPANDHIVAQDEQDLDATQSETLFALAGSIATLDAVESKLMAIQSELHRIRSEQREVDLDKVGTAFKRLIYHTNNAVCALDMQCANLMRDAKLDIRFTDLDRMGQKSVGMQLTIISVEKLLDSKVATMAHQVLSEHELSDFVDRMTHVVSSNIHVLSSILLTICAARDYTDAMMKLLANEGFVSPEEISSINEPEISSSTLDALSFGMNGTADSEDEHRPAAIVHEILQALRQNRHDVIARIGNR
ncbi:MAG: hypothetical protein ACR2PA_14360 [Hyphomicrobiaceae bacterium]